MRGLISFTDSAQTERTKMLLRCLIRPKGRESFLMRVPRAGVLIDVGCGNDSPFKIKALRPDLTYVGIDVADYAQHAVSLRAADRYIVTRPEFFHQAILEFQGTADAVVSAHNIEHCAEPEKVLAAMIAALNPDGTLYLSFPCEASVGFPSRGGVLNYYDDRQHQRIPLYSDILHILHNSGAIVEFSARQYHPLLATVAGAILEPYSRATNRICRPGLTWALYGFETVIWARRSPDGMLGL